MCAALAQTKAIASSHRSIRGAEVNRSVLGRNVGGHTNGTLRIAPRFSECERRWQVSRGLRVRSHFPLRESRCQGQGRRSKQLADNLFCTDVRWQGWWSRKPSDYAHNSRWCQKTGTLRRAGKTGDGTGTPSESTSEGDPQPDDVQLDFEKWSKWEFPAMPSNDKDLSVRSDPWASDLEPESGSSSSGKNRVPGEVSSEAAAVLGKSGTRASFPVTPSEASGLAEAPIKVEVPAQDHSRVGIEVLTLLSEVDKKKAFEKAQAKQTWWGTFVYETCSIALFIWGSLRTAAFATFHFLVKQPGELFNLSWPSPGETVSTMGLVTGTIAVLLVLISTMDTGFTFVLASLVRRSAK